MHTYIIRSTSTGRASSSTPSRTYVHVSLHVITIASSLLYPAVQPHHPQTRTQPQKRTEPHINSPPNQTTKQYLKLYEGVEPPVAFEKVNERWEVGVGISDGQFQQVSFVNGICTVRDGWEKSGGGFGLAVGSHRT